MSTEGQTDEPVWCAHTRECHSAIKNGYTCTCFDMEEIQKYHVDKRSQEQKKKCIHLCDFISVRVSLLGESIQSALVSFPYL